MQVSCPKCLEQWWVDGSLKSPVCPHCKVDLIVPVVEDAEQVVAVGDWHCPHCHTQRLPEKIWNDKSMPWFFLFGSLAFFCIGALFVLAWWGFRQSLPNFYWRCSWCGATLTPQQVDALK